MTWSPDYATTAELKSDIRIADTVDDEELALALTAASRAIDQITNRQFGRVATTEARIYTARFDRYRARWVIDTDDILTATGLTILVDDNDDQTYDRAVTSYRLLPVNEDEKGRPWTAIAINPGSAILPTAAADAVQVTASFGWAAVPTTIKEAAIRQAARFFYRREAPFGVAGSPALGSELRLLSQVDPDVAVMVRPYRRVWGAV